MFDDPALGGTVCFVFPSVVDGAFDDSPDTFGLFALPCEEPSSLSSSGRGLLWFLLTSLATASVFFLIG